MQAQIPFVGPAYASTNTPLALQESVNYYLEVDGDDARTPLALRGTGGLTSWVTGLNGPIKGGGYYGGVLYVIAGGKFYSVDSVGTATERGSVSTGTRWSTSYNGTQVVMVNGSVGYVYTVSTATLAKITDVDFVGASTVTFQDSYFIFEENGTGRFFISNINDGSAYDSLDFATAEAAPDDTLAVISDHRQLVLFGENTIEFWYNSGDIDFTFARQEGTIIERGLGGKYTIAKNDNSFIWLGDDRKVYRANGYTPIAISNPAIEEEFKGYTISDAFAWSYTWKGQRFYTITFPTDEKTWECNINYPPNKAWHRRESYLKNRWRANTYFYAYNKHLVGDFEAGTIWEMDDTYVEGSDPLVSKRVTNYIHADQKSMFMQELDILMQSGTGTVSGEGKDPQAMLRTSKNGGRTWSTERRAAIGQGGDYNRVYFRNLGKFKSKAFEFSISDPVNRDIIGAVGEVTVGV